MRHSFVSNIFECAVTQIENFPRNSNAVFIGTSRTRAAIGRQQAIEDSAGAFSHPMNLGRPGYSSVRGLAMMLDLLRMDAKIAYLFYEFEPDFRSGNKWEVSFFQFDNDTAILARQDYHLLYRAASNLPVPQRVRLFVDIELSKVRLAFFRLVSGSWQNALRKSNSRQRWVCGGPKRNAPINVRRLNQVRDSAEAGASEWWKDDHPLRRPQNELQNLEFNLVSVVQALADQHDINVTFTRVPSAYAPPNTPRSIERLQSDWRGFVSPDGALRLQLVDGGYVNPSHLNRDGQSIYTRWIVERMMQNAHRDL